ncbi:MAG: hypothetical protein NUV77_14795 [Thermoguttaceae bacterium]|nr:hypothetical protein [Thermoguttaceae bacterium]
MDSTSGSLLVAGLATVQVLGLFASLGTRLSTGSRFEGKCRCLFLALLGLAGMATVVALAMTPAYWVVSGASFSVMVLVATCDFQRSDHAGVW